MNTYIGNIKEKPRIVIMASLMIVSLISIYYFHLVLQFSALFTHFFYIPIILSCIWWNRKGIFVAAFLAGNLLFSHLFYEWHMIDVHDILRSVMFIIVAILVVELRKNTSRAQEETRLAYEKIDKIFQTTGNGLRVIDTEYNMIKFNEGFLNLLGLTKKEVEGKKCYKVFRGPLCNTPDCTLSRILGGEDRVECDIEKERNDGTKIYCILTATPIKGTDGELIGIIEDLKDITDRKIAEEALKESERKYSSFVKNLRGIAYQAEIDFTPIFFHGAVEEITGYTEEEFIAGRPKWVNIIHEDDLVEIYKTSRKLNSIPHYSTDRKYRIICKNGKTKWVEEIIQNICDDSGSPAMIQGIIYDINEKIQAENALQKSEERFLQAQKMEAVGRLAGGVAHDFNNLITIIAGNSDLLLDDLDESNPMRSDVEEIFKAAERAGSLTRQLLAFSRRQMLKTKEMNLNTVIKDVESLLIRLIGEDIEMITDLEPDLPLTKADPGQVEQVIMNLVVNARDAMPNGGTLIIRTEKIELEKDQCKLISESHPGKFVRLSVEDTGIGMEKGTISQIFEPFFSTKQKGEGTGLGLSTVYGIVKQHDGFVNVYSEPGHGSIFRIYLPALSVKQEGKPKAAVSLEEFQGKGERILLVEDEDGVRQFASKALGKNGYVVFEAANAHEAIAMFEREGGNFYMVLSDVVLPDIDGIRLADRLKSKNPNLKIVLCSGYSDQKSQWSLINERNIRFIKKPYNRLDLLKAVKMEKDPQE
ncbi:PAS domain S-box protein [bacterium]|nr:PAS domain S-box protein [bacterium]